MKERSFARLEATSMRHGREIRMYLRSRVDALMLQSDPHVLREAMRRTITAGEGGRRK